MLKVEGKPDLRRDENGAIVSVNKKKLEAAKLMAKAQREKDQEIKMLRVELNELREQINKLNSTVQELKNGR
jgi:uncharacterized coiled-coil DUF342 family protein